MGVAPCKKINTARQHPAHAAWQARARRSSARRGGRAQDLQHCKHTRIGLDIDGAVSGISGGERRRVSVGIGLVTDARVLFLDEPTIGLDVAMQRRIRTFIAEYNRRNAATVLLTSHYMADVEALCRRVIVIHHGQILFDGSLSALVGQFAAYKTIGVTLDDTGVDLSAYGEVTAREDGRVLLRVPKADTSRITARLLADLPVLDLTVEEPPIEDVIERVFTQGGPV